MMYHYYRYNTERQLLPILLVFPQLTLPQGTVLNSWKVVWVVLSEDGLEFYKKKSDRSPKGMIPLNGATLMCPCQDFSKRMVNTRYQEAPPSLRIYMLPPSPDLRFQLVTLKVY